MFVHSTAILLLIQLPFYCLFYCPFECSIYCHSTAQSTANSTIIIMDPCIDYCGSRTLDCVLATDRGFWIGSDYKRGLGMGLRQGRKSAGVGSVWLKSHF